MYTELLMFCPSVYTSTSPVYTLERFARGQVRTQSVHAGLIRKRAQTRPLPTGQLESPADVPRLQQRSLDEGDYVLVPRRYPEQDKRLRSIQLEY